MEPYSLWSKSFTLNGTLLYSIRAPDSTSFNVQEVKLDSRTDAIVDTVIFFTNMKALTISTIAKPYL